jgi:transcriptional regulator with XRE-family HTH domain
MPGHADAERPSPRALFGERLRSLRIESGLSQEELADRSHVHRTYVSSVERGQRNVSIDIIVRLAEALDIPASELFEGWG